jgi:hypothetical protein
MQAQAQQQQAQIHQQGMMHKDQMQQQKLAAGGRVNEQ